MSNITSIPAPRVPFIDERTGLISREWYRFFLNLFVLTGSGTTDASWTDLQLAPMGQSVSVDVDAPGLGSVCPTCYGAMPSDEYGLQVLPGYPVPPDDAGLVPPTERQADNLVIPPYPELTLPDILSPAIPPDLTQRVESLTSEVQGLMLAPPDTTFTTAIRRGSIRKTATTQTIGTMGASFVAITNYDSSGFTAGSGVTVNLTNGTLTPANAGDYFFIISVSLQFDSSASPRFFAMRVYDTTAAAALTDVAITPFVAPNLTGYTFGATLPFTISPSQINHVLRLEIGSGSSFTTTTCPNATFAMYSVGLL
jgi:hypothetical protein